MLKDGKCSIYDVRPFSCRVHYVLDADDLLCKIVPGETIEAPMFNTNQINMLYMLAHVTRPDQVFEVKMADIREFFPEGA
jgi:Fe-S-cluster containining protein